ncbi:prostaglandin E synthase 2-like protein [Leptotrombidium deliense]|uniref:Prostaglandin E synthase 2-like protein n=1 Tax=Leptotrombidium deliense TaxID=299467 RepID=A0A443SE44_9ACAR|nr:prostaglandin E synthase 2-like protein [Leptotrombidium deliense]
MIAFACMLRSTFNRNIQRLPLNSKPSTRKVSQYFLFAVAVGGSVGAFEYWKLMREHRKAIEAEEHKWDYYTKTLKTIPGLSTGLLVPRSVLQNTKISRSIPGPTKLPGISLTLFQYQTCPFCCKVRAFLDYYGIPYNLVEVNPVFRSQIKFSNYRKVPIILVDKEGEEDLIQLNDSSLIISILRTLIVHSGSSNEDLKSLIQLYQNISYSDLSTKKEVKQVVNRYFLMFGDTIGPETYKKMEQHLIDERKWRQWGDEVFVHVLSPNVYRHFGESLRTFEYFSKVGNWEEYFPQWERLFVIYLGASVMLFVSKMLKRKHSLKDDVRESLYDECRNWLKAIGKNKMFMGGDKPDLADLTIYGLLSSIEGCEAFQDLLKHTNIAHWYYAVKECCKNNAGQHEINLKT